MTGRAQRNQLIKFPILPVVENMMNVMMSLTLWFATQTTLEAVPFSDLLLDKLSESQVIRIDYAHVLPIRIIGATVFPDMPNRVFPARFKDMTFPVEGISGTGPISDLFESTAKHGMIFSNLSEIDPRFAEKVIFITRRKLRMKHPQFGAPLSLPHIGLRLFAFGKMQLGVGLGEIHRLDNPRDYFVSHPGSFPYRFHGAHVATTTLASARGFLATQWTKCFSHISYPFKRYYETLLTYCQYIKYLIQEV